MKEQLGYFLMCTAICSFCIAVFGWDINIKDKVLMFLFCEFFIGILIIAVNLLIG